MSDETTLLPCPFCGSENVCITEMINGTFRVICVVCRASHSATLKTRDAAICRWNMRAIPATFGGGNLTAEQVRKAIEGHGNIMDNRLYEDWQAVVDELNAELGSDDRITELTNAINELQKKQPYCYNPENPLDTLNTIGRYIDELKAKLGNGTCELRDERGVVQSDHYLSTTWRDRHGILHLAGESMDDGSLVGICSPRAGHSRDAGK